MIKKLKNRDHFFLAILFHIGIGIAGFIFRPFMIFYLYSTILYFLWRIIFSKPSEKVKEVLIACAYIAGSEIFFRMTKALFFYETGKYVVMLYAVVGIFYTGLKRKAFVYIMFLLLLIPGIIVSYNKMNYELDYEIHVLFNLSGPVCLGYFAVFSYGKKLTYKQFLQVLNYLVYPIISLTVYVILYNPDLRDVITNTASNSAASGGYGPNQVATVLGLGIFVFYSRLFIPYKNKITQLVIMFILGIMTLRGILTFARGGILTTVLVSITFTIIFFTYTNLKSKLFSLVKIIGMLGAVFLIWTISLEQSGGLIGNRYANRDSLGREKEDFSTGRVDLMREEMKAFKSNIIFGVGAGQIKGRFIEELGSDIPTHNEVTRMLAEHGIFGVFALLILIIAPLINNPLGIKNIYFYPLLLFWFLTISHSAMRLALPAFIYGLSLINITREKKTPIHRKQIN